MENTTKERSITLGATLLTAIAACWLLIEMYSEPLFTEHPFRAALQSFAVLFLIYGNFVFLISRYGYFKRKEKHQPPTNEQINELFTENAPLLTILVPSYKEEATVIRQTLISAALQEYPNRRVVLLIDDPLNEKETEQTKNIPNEILTAFKKPAEKIRTAHHNFLHRVKSENIDLSTERHRLLYLHAEVADWFNGEEKKHPSDSHIDQTFISLTFLEREKKHRTLSLQLNTLGDVKREYRRLASIFDVEITFFQRKQYANLSHAPNKAMNLNSYIGLMGKHFIEENGCLVEAGEKEATLSIPDSPFVAMLDADSILSHDYSTKLISTLNQPENSHIAVIQTPYSAFPNPPGILERIAGATTDIQYNIHQGFTYFGATFWVGANAIARKSALEAIAEEGTERGYPIKRFIQDRTVIEDTESSIDLVDQGWQLYNYPERLSYSATPQDFGSLLIQRRRWANGGLLIAPKLVRYTFRNLSRVLEGAIRFHYLTSIAGSLLSLAIFAAFPLPSESLLIGAFLTILPYLFCYARDLKLTGYRHTELFKVVALNVLLIPVNLAGVLKSLKQACTGEHTPFCRTPKIQGRTLVPALYLLLEYLLAGYAITIIGRHFLSKEWTLFFLSLTFAAPLIYSNLAFIGLNNTITDFTALKQKQLSVS